LYGFFSSSYIEIGEATFKLKLNGARQCAFKRMRTTILFLKRMLTLRMCVCINNLRLRNFLALINLENLAALLSLSSLPV
jgi:hypothetical protein